jgi:hypothetical protein
MVDKKTSELFKYVVYCIYCNTSSRDDLSKYKVLVDAMTLQ